MLLTAIADGDQRIGLIATASTTYNDPFNLARRFASRRPRQRRPRRLERRDHRRPATRPATSGWTTSPRTRERYERADEFLEVAYQLWDSWEDDAPLGDKASGVWGDHDADPRRSTTSAGTSGSAARSTCPRSRRAAR